MASTPGQFDPFYHVVALPYAALRAPRLRLKAPQVALPSAMTVFGVVLLSYFLVVSGVVYDAINEPPGIGSKQDPNTGQWVPQVFMEGRINGQYIIEGLSAGFMFVLGGLGLILIDLGCDRMKPKNMRMTFIGTGFGLAVIAYLMSMLFLRIKVPGYLS